MLQLQRVLEEDADRDRTRALLADMLGPVLIGRDADTGETWAEIEKPAERLLLLGGSLKVVAGAGFEPTGYEPADRTMLSYGVYCAKLA